jgi:pimeloyl-ACP methyl ester carboxylesterase
MASPRALRDVTAGGARVRFVEAGDGHPLLLIHGYLSSRLVWDDVLPGLATKFRVIVPDLPGFGDSEKPPPARYAYGFQAFAESLVDVIAALDLGRISVCGHGMGGGVALMLAARHPAMVENLLLVDPIVYPHKAHMLARIAGVPVVGPIAFKQFCGRTMFNRHFKERVYGAESKIPWTRVDHLFHLFNVPAAREAACATTRAIGDTRPLVALLPRVTAPTLVTWGRSDRATPVAHGRRLARELQNARFEVFECGHSPPEECPDAFVEVVCDFLAKVGGRAA